MVSTKPLSEILKSPPDDFYVIHESIAYGTLCTNVRTASYYELQTILQLHFMYFEEDYKRHGKAAIELIEIGYIRKCARDRLMEFSFSYLITDLLDKDFMTNRFLAWKSNDGQMIPVNQMTDEHLLNCIRIQRSRIAAVKLQTGHTSLSILTLKYMEEEADERGLDPNAEQINDLTTYMMGVIDGKSSES